MFEKELAKLKAERSKKKPQKKKKDSKKAETKREKRIANRKEIEELEQQKDIEPIVPLETEEEEIFVEEETAEIEEEKIQEISTKEPPGERIEGLEEQEEEEEEEITELVEPQDLETKEEAPEISPEGPSDEVTEKREEQQTEEKIVVSEEPQDIKAKEDVPEIPPKEPSEEGTEKQEEQQKEEEITELEEPQDLEVKEEAPIIPLKEPSEEVTETREEQQKEEEITELEELQDLEVKEEALIIPLKEPSEEVTKKPTEILKEKLIRISEKPRKIKRKEKPGKEMGEREVLKRYKRILQENKNLTIKEFVEKLKLAPTDPSYLKSISPEDAVHILVVIGLHSFPFGPVLRRSVMEEIGKDPQKVTYQKLLDSITAINVDEIKDKKLLRVIRNVYSKINLRTIADPYQSKIQLKEHALFQKIIRKPMHIKLAKIIGVPEEGLRKLSEKIPEERTFLGLENKQIRDEFQIKLELIQDIKEAMLIMRRFEVKPKLAVIISQNFKQDELTSLNLEEIKAAIKKSSIKIQEVEYSNEKLKKIQTLIENQNPKIVYLYKVIAELDLQSALKMYINEYKIRSITDFNKTVVENNERKNIFDIISAKADSKQKIEQLKAYSRLSRLSKNFELNKALIENNLTSFHKITQIPLFEFQNKFITKASKNELKEIYYRAQRNFAKSVTRRSFKTIAPQNRQFDYLVNKLTSKKK